MALQLFDFNANCTRSIELYNELHGGTVDLVPLLRGLLRPDQNVSDSLLLSQLTSETFIKGISHQIGDLCNTLLYSSLHFTGNADIAGVGVSTHI